MTVLLPRRIGGIRVLERLGEGGMAFVHRAEDPFRPDRPLAVKFLRVEAAADSVTDGFGRVHGRPWLRVADSSLFPDALEINPYLTIMALADRVADGLLADLKTT